MRRAHRTTAWTAGAVSHTTAGLAAEVAEAVGQGDDYVTTEGVVQGLGVVVRGVGDREVLGLVEDVVGIQGKSELILEQEFGDLGIQDQLGALIGGVAVVPVVVTISHDSEAARDCPVHRGGNLIAPRHVRGLVGDRVPGF